MNRPPPPGSRRSLPARVAVALLLLTAAPLLAQPDDEVLPEWIGEPNSPAEQTPASVTPGLGDRAIPALAAPTPPPTDYNPLYRLTRPYYDTLFATAPPSFIPPPDPSAFRRVIVNEAPRGLQPRTERPGLLEIYPAFGLAQSYDSNVNLTATDPIRDFFLTPQASVEFQLGSPDTIYEPVYDTILALHGSYEGYADLFYEHPELSAYNQRLELTGRIGRSAAIWRPFLYFSDITGSNLLLVELVNRTRRLRVTAGFFAEYKLSEIVGYRQNFNYFRLDHPDPAYIDLQTWNTRQELTYLALHALRAIAWGQYRFTQPDRGSAGQEFVLGAAWQGQPDPRIYTELYVGYGLLDMQGQVPGRRNLSGLRFNGYTTFDWGPRFRPTLRYDREYAFNELQENDNYTSTLLQVRNEFFLGGNYYLTPYLGVAIDEFETSHQVTIQWRPEVELSYAFANEQMPNESRVFLKAGYEHSSNLVGEGDPISQLRLSFGANWKF